jgi:hypothetical protein
MMRLAHVRCFVQAGNPLIAWMTSRIVQLP